VIAGQALLMKAAPSMSKIVGAAGASGGRTAVVASTRAACSPDAMTKLMLQPVPHQLTRCMASSTNCDKSMRTATTALAALYRPTRVDRTTALISMKAVSLLAVPFLRLHLLHVVTTSPNGARSLAVIRENIGAIDRSTAADKGPGSGPAMTGTDTTRGAHAIDLRAADGGGADCTLKTTRVATSGNSKNMLLWPVLRVTWGAGSDDGVVLPASVVTSSTMLYLNQHETKNVT